MSAYSHPTPAMEDKMPEPTPQDPSSAVQTPPPLDKARLLPEVRVSQLTTPRLITSTRPKRINLTSKEVRVSKKNLKKNQSPTFSQRK